MFFVFIFLVAKIYVGVSAIKPYKKIEERVMFFNLRKWFKGFSVCLLTLFFPSGNTSGVFSERSFGDRSGQGREMVQER